MCLICCSCFYKLASFGWAAFENPAWRGKVTCITSGSQPAAKPTPETSPPGSGLFVSRLCPFHLLSCLMVMHLLRQLRRGKKKKTQTNRNPFPPPLLPTYNSGSERWLHLTLVQQVPVQIFEVGVPQNRALAAQPGAAQPHVGVLCHELQNNNKKKKGLFVSSHLAEPREKDLLAVAQKLVLSFPVEPSCWPDFSISLCWNHMQGT